MRLYIVENAIKALAVIVPLLVAVAYFTLVERKVMAAIQRRRGPNVAGLFGLLQPLADGLKLFLKETIRPSAANGGLFLLAPMVTFTLSLVAWAVRPRGETMVRVDSNIGVLYMFAISALAVYGIVMAGWSSNSKYAFLGGLRSTAQRVSYEVSIGFVLIGVLLCSGTTNLSGIVLAQEGVWYRFPLFPMYLMFFVSCLAETNRHPFDLPEAEAELVSGYNVEYSAMGFALFFLGEYGNMILRSCFTVLLFMGGWLAPLAVAPFTWVPGPIWFGTKARLFVALFAWARAAYPRYRYDQLRRLGWKVFLPVSLGWVLFTAGVLMGMDALPV